MEFKLTENENTLLWDNKGECPLIVLASVTENEEVDGQNVTVLYEGADIGFEIRGVIPDCTREEILGILRTMNLGHIPMPECLPEHFKLVWDFSEPEPDVDHYLLADLLMVIGSSYNPFSNYVNMEFNELDESVA